MVYLIEWTERCVKTPGENVTHTPIFKRSESVPLLLSAAQNKTVLWINHTFTVLSIIKCELFSFFFYNFAAFWKISAWSWRVMSSAREILQNLNSAHKWKHYYDKFISLCVIELQLACIVSFKYIEVNLALVEKNFFCRRCLVISSRPSKLKTWANY